MLLETYNRDNHPGLVSRVRKSFVSITASSHCPRCNEKTSRVIDYLGSLMWECEVCRSSWKYNGSKTTVEVKAITIRIGRKRGQEKVAKWPYPSTCATCQKKTNSVLLSAEDETAMWYCKPCGLVWNMKPEQLETLGRMDMGE